jgi:hypothetical protein
LIELIELIELIKLIELIEFFKIKLVLLDNLLLKELGSRKEKEKNSGHLVTCLRPKQTHRPVCKEIE